MRRRAWLAALLLFVITVIVRLPASWALHLMPGTVSCEAAAGSVWRGGCARLLVADTSIGPLKWTLHVLPLLIGRLDAEVHSDDARLPGRARLTLRSGARVEAHALSAQLALSSNLLPGFPEGWQGRVRLNLATLGFDAGRLISLQGTVDVDSLAQLSPPMAMGSYQLRFDRTADAAGAIVGTLRDSAGPLSVAGTIHYTAQGGYEISGTVMARADATPELRKAVEYLGAADPEGRRPFSLAGTF